MTVVEGASAGERAATAMCMAKAALADARQKASTCGHMSEAVL